MIRALLFSLALAGLVGAPASLDQKPAKPKADEPQKKDGKEELVLAGEVVVDELLVDAAALGDGAHSRAAEAVAGEFRHRRAQDLLAGAVGIARADLDDGAGAGGHPAIIHQTVNYPHPGEP